MVTAGNADNLEHWVEDVLAEATMCLAVIDQHLLHDFIGRHTAEAARLCPCLIDDAIAGHSIGWQRAIYLVQQIFRIRLSKFEMRRLLT